jgi:hypothetical protein
VNNKLKAIAFGCLATGCAPTIWDKPGGTQAQFNQESARCQLVAQGMNSGDFYAQGSQSFVAGAALGNAIGTAIGTAATYRNCMMATGYTPRDPQVQENISAVPGLAAYGAFAYDDGTHKYGYSRNELNERAEEAALKGCGTGTCKVMFRTGPRECGAIALSADEKAWGGARRDRPDTAQTAAIANCQKRTTVQCKIIASACNS